MIKLSFPTKKLKKYIKRVNIKLKDTNYNQNELTVYGVTNTEGITITGNPTSDDLSNYIVLRENQLVYNPYRVNVGSIGLATKGLIGLVSPAYIVFEATEELNAEFLYYYLKSSLGIKLIKWYGDRGGVRSALRYEDLCEIDIPDLNLMQQVSVLNKMKEVDKEIENFNNEVSYQKQLISKLRQSTLQEAVQGKLVPQDPNDEPASVLLEKLNEEKEKFIKEGKIKREKPLPPITDDEIPYDLPKGWEWVRLGSISDISTGCTPLKSNESYYLGGKIPWCTSTVTGNEYVSEANNYITNKALEECNLKLYPVGTLIMAMYGQGKTRGQITELLIETTINQACAAVILMSNEIEHRKYVKMFLKRVYNDIRSLAEGGAQPNINLVKVKKLVLPLPPLNEQKRIVEKVDQLMALCDELEKNIQQSKKDSEMLMQSVLQEAFKEAQ